MALGALTNAVANEESGGDYGALGKVTKSGDRAYGKYQVMGANIPQWTKETLGIALTPQQFLNSPKAQDIVARAKLGQYLSSTGSPQDAASMWFTGKLYSEGSGLRDSNGVTGAGYVANVVRNMGGAAGVPAYLSAASNSPDPFAEFAQAEKLASSVGPTNAMAPASRGGPAYLNQNAASKEDPFAEFEQPATGTSSGPENFNVTPAGVSQASPGGVTPGVAGASNPGMSANFNLGLTGLREQAAQSASATSPATSDEVGIGVPVQAGEGPTAAELGFGQTGLPDWMTAPGGGLDVMNSLPIVGPGILAAGAGVNALLNGDSYASERALQAQQMAEFSAQHPYAATGADIAGNLLGTSAAIGAAPAAFGIGSGLGAGANALLAAGTDAGLNAADTGVRGGSASDVGRAAAIGAAGGAGGALLGSGLNAAGRLLSGGTLSADDAALAAAARARGIPLTADQLSRDTGMGFLRSASDRLPFSGAQSDIADTQAAINRVASQAIGEDAAKITPDVMLAARQRIGGYYDSVAKNTVINVDPQFLQDIHDTLNNAFQVLPKSEAEPLAKQAQNIIEKIDRTTKTIPGDTYQALTNTGAPLDRLVESENPNVSFYANSLKKALDNALERSAAPEQQALLRTADQQWAAMRTIQPIVAKTGGDVSPALLAGRVNAATGNGMAFGYGGDLGELARIGQRFMKQPPSSGTAERLGALGAMGGLVEGGNALLTGSLAPAVHSLGIVPAALALNRYAINPALRSRWLANALINRSLPGAVASGPSVFPAIGSLASSGANALLQGAR